MKKLIRQILIEETEDEVKFMNESKGNKKSNYHNLIKKLVEPFKDEEGVCDIRVVYNEEDDMYDVFAVTSTEKLREKFFYVDSIQQYLFKLRTNIKKTITNYLPIKNLYVGSYGKPNCEWKPINESKEVDKVKIAKKIIQTMFDNVTYIEQKKYENKPLLKVYFERISNAANEDSWMTHQICDKIDEYTSGHIIAAPSWGPEWSKRKKSADLYIDASEGGVVEFDNPF